jgi:hypothetical protein
MVEFDAGVINTITVNTRGGVNYVKVAAVPSGVTVNLDNYGPLLSFDSIVIGSDAGSLAGIQGTLKINRFSQVVINDSSDGARTIAITNSSVAYSGLTTINYTPLVALLELIDADGANQIHVVSVGTNIVIEGDALDNLYGPAQNEVHLNRVH